MNMFYKHNLNSCTSYIKYCLTSKRIMIVTLFDNLDAKIESFSISTYYSEKGRVEIIGEVDFINAYNKALNSLSL